MSDAIRACNKWWTEDYGDHHPTGIEFNKEDLERAFLAGYEAGHEAALDAEEEHRTDA